nr:hypothetical protein 32 [bacterium]
MTKIDRRPDIGKPHSELPTEEQENHAIYETRYVDGDGNEIEASKGVKQAVNKTQHTLDYCLFREIITEEQYLAGERFYRDCYYAGFVPRATTINLTSPIRTVKSTFHFIEGKVESMERYTYVARNLQRQFINRSRNITYWNIAYEVCCEGITLTDLETGLKWTRGSGKYLLRMVLNEIEYSYAQIAKGALRAKRKRKLRDKLARNKRKANADAGSDQKEPLQSEKC